MRIMSKNFERWKELATLTSKEQDPAKLTELAMEMNLVLNQKTQNLDPPLHANAGLSLRGWKRRAKADPRPGLPSGLFLFLIKSLAAQRKGRGGK
jgi:hypothetical protein